MKYMLDTNIITAIEKAPLGALNAKLMSVGIDNIVTSIIVVGEVQFGIIKRKSASLTKSLGAVLSNVPALPLEPPVELEYGRIRADLERKGTPIGQNDMWIAAHAITLNLTLVTDKASEFERVEGLRVENWLRS
jgi:tRNA(fMet)-specific endonuclease VapC